jgi:hypothetical protein
MAYLAQFLATFVACDEVIMKPVLLLRGNLFPPIHSVEKFFHALTRGVFLVFHALALPYV